MTDTKKKQFLILLLNFRHKDTSYDGDLYEEEKKKVFDFVESEIDEACKKQREICANTFMTKEDYLYIKLNAPDTISTLKREEILNSPSPKESDNGK